jgi:TolB-like protein/DNA-binding winged helix-turn-helix (wHTH) protein
MAEAQIPTRFRFGVFELDVTAAELRKHGIPVRLRGQPFQLLTLLLERHGEIVTREEMRARLWPGDTFVEFEHSLNTAMKKLRAALGDSPENSRYVETLPRMGYRFVAPVEKVAGATGPLPAVAAGPPGADAPLADPRFEPISTGGRRLLRRRPVILGIALALAAALGGYFQWARSRAGPQAFGKRVMLAVLPFENLTGDPGQDYFTDGLTEEMIAQLGRLDPQRLGVIARTSVMYYKHRQEPLEQIGGELGVQYVLEGSVRRDSDNVRISAQLIRVADQTHLWSRQYDRQMSNLLALQGEIARETAGEIEPVLLEQEDRSGIPAGRRVFSAGDKEGSQLRSGVCRSGELLHPYDRIQRGFASPIYAQSARGRSAGPGAQREFAGGAHRAGLDRPELRLGLANRGERIPAGDRGESKLRHRSPLVCRALDVAGPLRRSVP